MAPRSRPQLDWNTPATVYSYAVSAVDSTGNEGPLAYPSVYLYEWGVANQQEGDYS